MDPVTLTFVLQEDVTPKTLEFYSSLCNELGEPGEAEFRREILQRLEESFDLQEQVTTLQAQVEAYQEYIYELNDRLKILEHTQTGIEQILREIQEVKQAITSEENEDSPKHHARPSLAIRTLKRLQEKEEEGREEEDT